MASIINDHLTASELARSLHQAVALLRLQHHAWIHRDGDSEWIARVVRLGPFNLLLAVIGVGGDGGVEPTALSVYWQNRRFKVVLRRRCNTKNQFTSQRKTYQ